MYLKPILSGVLFALLTPVVLNAQTNLVEGSVTYIISSSASQSEPLKPSGTFTLTFKEGMIRKDIRMNNGYTNTIILNGKTNQMYSLRTLAATQYAVEMDNSEYQAKQKKYIGFTLTTTYSENSSLGYSAKQGTIIYPDGKTTTIIYTPDVQISEHKLFERFPGLQYLPLVFTYEKEDGPALHLELQKVEAKPVETSLFTIPAGYKIISSKELKDMKK